MLNARKEANLGSSPKTWIVVAHKAGARLLESDGGVSNLHTIEVIDFPPGRLKNREINTDREGTTMGEAGADYPVHGLVNKGEPAFHELQIFARQLAGRLQKARAENAFERLVLVAESRFLGELRVSLDPVTASRVTATFDKTLTNFDERALNEHLRELMSLHQE